MFNCGPRPMDWPSAEALLGYSSADMMDLTNEYWFWGMRCDQQLRTVELYIKCNKGDKDSCKSIDNIKKLVE